MPELEAIINAIMAGSMTEEQLANLHPAEKQNVRQRILDFLMPALPAIKEMQAVAWQEGSTARDIYLRDLFVGEEGLKDPENPYL